MRNVVNGTHQRAALEPPALVLYRQRGQQLAFEEKRHGGERLDTHGRVRVQLDTVDVELVGELLDLGQAAVPRATWGLGDAIRVRTVPTENRNAGAVVA